MTPVSLKSAEEQAKFAALDLDVAVVAAYGLILPRAILDAPRRGCLNVHASLLPRWRGAAPVQRAILAGDAVTGVTIMDMEAGLDTGPMRATAETAIERKTAGALTSELAGLGAVLIVDVLAALDSHPPVVQPEDGAPYAPKLEKSEARLDFAVDADAVERKIRAFNPAPGAFFEYAGERVRVLTAAILPLPPGDPAATRPSPSLASLAFPSPLQGEGVVLDDRLTIACANGAIRPTLVQRAGRGAMTTAELLRGFPIPAGTSLA